MAADTQPAPLPVQTAFIAWRSAVGERIKIGRKLSRGMVDGDFQAYRAAIKATREAYKDLERAAEAEEDRLTFGEAG